MKRFGFPLVLAGLLCGCIDDLPEAWDIEDTRIIGARVEPEGDPDRAWVKPGETAQVSLLVVHPELDRTADELRMMAVVCTPLSVGMGPPLCLEFLALAGEGMGGGSEAAAPPGALEALQEMQCEQVAESIALLPGLDIDLICLRGEPRFQLTVPSNLVGDGQERLVRGVLCEKGEPYIDPSSQALFGCRSEEGGEEIAFSLTVPIQGSDATNHHPSLAGASVTLDGDDWAAAAPASELAGYLLPALQGRRAFDCRAAEAAGLVEIAPAGTRSIGIRVSEDDFESFEDDGEQSREELRFGIYTTDGRLERNRSVLQADDDPLAFDLEWKAPETIPERGLLVRFFLTVRDQRGGFDSIERALCVTKSAEE